MINHYRRYRHNRKVAKIKEGDGHSLKPFKFWQMLTRSLYHINLKNTSGHYDKYSVNVEYYEAGEEVELYLNYKHIGSSSSPATFPVSGGYIDVQTTLYGLKRMHYVGDNHREIVLEPDAGTAEDLRKKFALKYPFASRLISWLAIFILLLSLIVGNIGFVLAIIYVLMVIFNKNHQHIPDIIAGATVVKFK